MIYAPSRGATKNVIDLLENEYFCASSCWGVERFYIFVVCFYKITVYTYLGITALLHLAKIAKFGSPVETKGRAFFEASNSEMPFHANPIVQTALCQSTWAAASPKASSARGLPFSGESATVRDKTETPNIVPVLTNLESKIFIWPEHEVIQNSRVNETISHGPS